MRNLRTRILVLAALALALAGALGFATMARAEHVEPVLYTNNPNCTDLGYSFGFKIDNGPFDGVFSLDGFNDVTVESSDGVYFNWSSELALDAVIVKGGTDSNVYFYDPEATSDDGLHSPVNASGEPAAISHIEFCYDYELTATKTADATWYKTIDWTIVKDFDENYVGVAGDVFPHGYKVTVTKNETFGPYVVDGEITINNPTPFAVTFAVSDFVDGVEADVNCPDGYTLAAGASTVCSYTAELGGAVDGTNTATITSLTAGVGGAEATAGYTFGDPILSGDSEPENINVTDTNGPAWATGVSWYWEYTQDFACPTDQSAYTNGVYTADPWVNTATITETGDSDIATVNLTCTLPALVPTKTAEGEYFRDITWDLTKTVDPATHSGFAGEVAGSSTWTVTATKTIGDPYGYVVTGTIEVYNPSAISQTFTVEDYLNDAAGTVASVLCDTYTVAPNATATCTYEAFPADGSADLNTAKVTAAGNTDQFATDDFIFAETLMGEESGTLSDPRFGYSEVISDTTVKTFPEDFTCPNDPALYEGDGHYQFTETNWAYLNDNIDLEDSASVTVDCYAPVVTKDADEFFTRYWDWTVDKRADQTELLLSEGQLFAVNYEVEVSAVSTDNDWQVTGTITIANPNPGEDMVLSDVTDNAGGIPAGVSCPSLTVPAGGQLVCTYDTGAQDSADSNPFGATNTATAVFNGANFTGTAPIAFPADPTTEVDECIDVSDTNVGFLGQVCAGDVDKTFEYSLTFGAHPDADVQLVCGDNSHRNIADFITNDTQTTGEDDWTVNANVACEVGCSLTPGYWKTHSEFGPAPYDDTWALLGGADTPFFLSNQTYYEVLWTSPQGNAYYILAHAYIAAELNFLNGADPTDAQAAFDAATVLFQTYTPAEIADAKGKAGNELRAQFIELAYTLDQYNNGYIGPGHCSEEPEA